MKILLLVNAKRRNAEPPEELIAQFREKLDNAGATYTIAVCSSPEDSECHIREGLKSGHDTIWIAGGDGTVNNVLNSTFGQKVAYGLIPMGTVNALARALNVPLDPLEAIDYLLAAKPVRMDIGEVGGRYFFCYATVGLHAAVFHNIDTDLKKKWGKLAFWESGIRTAWKKSRLPRFMLEAELADSEPGKGTLRWDHGYSLVVSNVANYAGFGLVTGDAPASDGYFDVHHFRQNQLWAMFRWFAVIKLFGSKKSVPDQGRVFFRARYCRLRSHRRLSLQIDGEPIVAPDRRAFEIKCLPGAVQLLLQSPQEERLRVEDPQPPPAAPEQE